MLDHIDKILKMLTLELESLIKDIKTLETTQEEREKKGELTKYVYLENTNFLTKELSSIRWVISRLNKDQFDEINNFEEFKEQMQQFLIERRKSANMPKAVHRLVLNKLEIIERFFNNDIVKNI